MDIPRLKKIAMAAAMVVTGVGWVSSPEAVAAPPGVHVTAPATTPAPELTSEDVNAWLDGLVPAALNSAEIPGAVVAVVKDGQVVTTRGFGYADVESKTPVTGDTVFQQASISKIPTTIAALDLVEEGKLDLDADISTYVDVPIERKFDEPITLRNLLTHTAGFEEREGPGVTYEQGASFDLAHAVLTDPPAQIFQPGTTPAYSNYGMDLMGYIVQEVAGQPFEQFVEDRVFKPAGMDSSTYRQPLPEDIAKRLATGYQTTGEKGIGFYTVAQPSGAMSSTGNDMAMFMNAQLNGTLLSPTMKEQAWSKGNESPYQGMTMGLGYFLEDWAGRKAVSHGGDVQYFHTNMMLYPEHNTGIYVAVNAWGKENGGPDLRDTVVAEFANRYLPIEPAPALTDAEAIKRAEEIAGNYKSSRAIDSNLLSMYNIAPGAWTAIEPTGDGGLMLGDRAILRQISPWLWEDTTGTRTISADPTRENKALVMGPVAFLPTTGVDHFHFYGLYTGLGLLILALLAWPLGAWRRLKRLSWPERLARVGALAALMAVGAFGWMISDLFSITTGEIRATQGFALVAALAVIPAGWGLVTSVRGRAGWKRYLSNTLVFVGLILFVVVVAAHHVYNPDVSF